MERRIASLLLLAVAGVICHAQEAAFQGSKVDQVAYQSLGTDAPVTEVEECAGTWERFHGFLFRRYAGSVEMESKTRYPKGYFGRFTYLQWRPDWVRTPSNDLRNNQYQHHFARPTSRLFEPVNPTSMDAVPIELQNAVPLELHPGGPVDGQLDQGQSTITIPRPMSRELVETIVE